MRVFTLEKTVPLKLMFLDNELDLVDIKSFELTFTLETDGTPYEDARAAQIDQNVSFSKLIYFLESVVDQSFVYIKDDAHVINRFLATNFNNNLIVVPDISENFFTLALHRKMNNIVAEHTIVERITLKDLDNKLTYEYFCNDKTEEIELPTNEEWMGELSYFEEPWWDRDDASTFDNYAEDQAEYDAWVKHKEDNDTVINPHNIVFDEIEKDLKKLFKQAFNKEDGNDEPQEAEVIEIDFANKPEKKWIPKIV